MDRAGPTFTSCSMRRPERSRSRRRSWSYAACGTLLFAKYRHEGRPRKLGAGRVTRLANSARNALWLDHSHRTYGSNCATAFEHHAQSPAGVRGRGRGVADSSDGSCSRAFTLTNGYSTRDGREIANSRPVGQAAVRALREPTRAINLLDIERLALDFPHPIARARAWPSMHPDYPCLTTPGVITLVIVPDQPVETPCQLPAWHKRFAGTSTAAA